MVELKDFDQWYGSDDLVRTKYLKRADAVTPKRKIQSERQKQLAIILQIPKKERRANGYLKNSEIARIKFFQRLGPEASKRAVEAAKQYKPGDSRIKLSKLYDVPSLVIRQILRKRWLPD